MNKKLLFLAGLAPLVAAPALVVASCSSSTTTDGSSTPSNDAKEQAKQAAIRAKNYLESKSYMYADKKPSELKDVVISAALKPSQNFGFKTEFFKGASNDDEGTQEIKIVTTRGELKSEPIIATLKLKSSKDDETDAQTKITDLLNLDQLNNVPEGSTFNGQSQQNGKIRRTTVFVKDYDNKNNTAPEASKISEFIEASKDVNDKKWKDLFLGSGDDSKVVSDGVTLGWKSLVKKSTTNLKPENFVLSNVHQTQIGSILAPSITFDLQLQNDKKDKKSGIVQVNLVGFRLDEGYKNQVQHLLEQAATEYGTLYSPIVDETKSVSKKASEIKNAEKPADELQKYLLTDWNIMGGDLIVPITIDVKIEEVVSANDSEGSLTVKFKFDRKQMEGEGSTSASTTKEIKLFGFQIV